MPLGYGYVKREATDYVNWAEIGKNMSDMLANENKIREEKKAAIDEDSRQIGLYLANAPTGQDANAKTAALKLADDATQYKNLQLKLLKSGKLKLKDYLVNTQNLKDSITQAFDAMTDYQKEFGARMDEYRANTLSRISVDDMADVEGFGNWLKSGFYVNPTNGVVNVALKDKKIIDGKEIYSMSENPNKVASMNYIRGLINTRVSKADVQKSTDEWASKLGKEVKWDKALSYVGNYYRGGKDFTIEDITSRQDIDPLTKDVIFEFKKAEEDYVNGVLVNPYVRGSVLIDYVGTAPNKKEYRITNDEADAKANPEAIYRKIDPSTQQGELIFNDEQKKVSEKYITNIARSKYNYEQKVQSTEQFNRPRANTEGEEKKIAQDNDALNFSEQTSNLFTGTPAQRAESVGYFRGKGAKVTINPKGKPAGVYVENSEGDLIPFAPEGNPMDQGKSAIGVLKTATGVDIPDEMIIKYFPKFMGKKFSASTGEITGVAPTRDVKGEFENKVVKKVRYTIFKKLDNNYALTLLRDVIGNTPGITYTPDNVGNDVKITYTPSKGAPKSIVISTNNQTDDEAKNAAEAVKTLLRTIELDEKESAIGPEVVEKSKGGSPAPVKSNVNYSNK